MGLEICEFLILVSPNGSMFAARSQFECSVEVLPLACISPFFSIKGSPSFSGLSLQDT